MSNTYYENGRTLIDGDIARADDVNQEFDRVQSAFDKLPDIRSDKKGFAQTIKALAPVEDDDAATKGYVDASYGSNTANLLATQGAQTAAETARDQAQSEALAAANSANNAANSASSAISAKDTVLAVQASQAADVLDALTTVDGSGSGLDADLLDGKHASEFATLLFATLSTGIPRPTKVSATSINVNGTTLTLPSPVAGTDYYFSLSEITTTQQADTIGGFHYGLTLSGETPTGNKTAVDITAIAGINQHSIWTNWFRPTCDPRGMVHVGGRWYDIYLMDTGYGIRKYSSPTRKTGLSIAGGAISNGRGYPLIPIEYGGTGTTNYGKLTWFQANEIAKAAGKALISYNDFPTIAYGVQEQVDASSQDGGVAMITHFANLTSKWGIEQATGTQWIWGADVGAAYANTDWGWKTVLTDARGDIYAQTNNPTAVLLGAYRDVGASAGSRASVWSFFVWNSNWNVGARFSCDHM